MTHQQAGHARRLGILAGGGSVPAEVAAAAVAGGMDVHVVAIDSEADADFGAVPVTLVNWGQIGRMLATFKKTGRTDLVIVGRVSRPDLTRVRPDMGLFASIPWILKVMASGGDDGVLRTVVRFFEHHGFRVLGPRDIAPGLVVAEGPLAGVALAHDDPDVAKGLDVIRRLGPFDVGQGVVVANGEVIAIEGAEGTDRMLARLAAMRADDAHRSGVLVKRPKPGQEMRVDMPVIGPETVTRVAQAGLAAIAVLAGEVMATQRVELARRADSEGIAVAGVREPAAAGVVDLAKRDGDDVDHGLAVLRCLQPDVPCRAVVVARKYVLAIEAGEGVEAVLTRVAGLRQWGSARIRKRVGYAVLSGDVVVEETIVAQVAAAGLHGLALVAGVGGEPFVTHKARKAALAAGVSIDTLSPETLAAMPGRAS